MMLCYLDSSAWVKRYFRELGSGWINQEFAHGILLGSSTLGLIEATATCARKRAAGAIDAVQLSRDSRPDSIDDLERLLSGGADARSAQSGRWS